jgi:hypothetical protein
LIEMYQNQLDKNDQELKEIEKKCEFFNGNVQGMKWIKQENYDEKMRKTFVPNSDHFKLLSEMEFKNFPRGGDIVWLGVDGKRPFGNSNYYSDAARILGIKKFDKDGDLFEKDKLKIHKLFDELPFAIEYIIKEKMKIFK